MCTNLYVILKNYMIIFLLWFVTEELPVLRSDCQAPEAVRPTV